MAGAIAIPVGLFWFAWSNYPSIHWISSVMAGAPFGFGMVLVFLAITIILLMLMGHLLPLSLPQIQFSDFFLALHSRYSQSTCTRISASTGLPPYRLFWQLLVYQLHLYSTNMALRFGHAAQCSPNSPCRVAIGHHSIVSPEKGTERRCFSVIFRVVRSK